MIADPGNNMVGAGMAMASASGSPAAERAARSLGVCCETFARSKWPEVAWRFSGLTVDGCPLEFAFSNVSNALRFTVDAAPPETENHERISAACGLAGRLGHPRLDAETVQRWTRMQQGRFLSWGARLGLRESGNGEAIKFYFEIPLEAQAEIRWSFQPPLGDSIAVMAGYEPQSGRTEYYFRQQQFSREQLACLLGLLAGKRERSNLLAGIEHACGMPVASALLWTCFGYSVTIEPRDPSAPRLALFARSRAVGGAWRASRRLLDCMPPSLKQRSLYCEWFAGLPESELPDHGVVSISNAPLGIFEMRVGLSAAALSRVLRARQEAAMAEAR
jgi:hypothetical protein